MLRRQASPAVFQRRAAAECTSGGNTDVTGRFWCGDSHVVVVTVMAMMMVTVVLRLVVLRARRRFACGLGRRSGGQDVAAAEMVTVGAFRRELATAGSTVVDPRRRHRLFAGIFRRSRRLAGRAPSASGRSGRLRGRRNLATTAALRHNRHDRVDKDESLRSKNGWSARLELVRISRRGTAVAPCQLYGNVARTGTWSAVDEPLQAVQWMFGARRLTVDESLEWFQSRQPAWRRRRTIVVGRIHQPLLLAVFHMPPLCVRAGQIIKLGRPTFRSRPVCRCGIVTHAKVLFESWRRLFFEVVVVVRTGSGEGRRVCHWRDERRGLRRRRSGSVVIVTVNVVYTNRRSNSATRRVGGRQLALHGSTGRTATAPTSTDTSPTSCLFFALRRYWPTAASGQQSIRWLLGGRLFRGLPRRRRASKVALNQRLHRSDSRLGPHFSDRGWNRRLSLFLWTQQTKRIHNSVYSQYYIQNEKFVYRTNYTDTKTSLTNARSPRLTLTGVCNKQCKIYSYRMPSNAFDIIWVEYYFAKIVRAKTTVKLSKQ